MEERGVAAEYGRSMLPDSSHGGETTEDDMNDDDDDDAKCNDRKKAENCASLSTPTAGSAALLSRNHSPAPLSAVVASLAVAAAPATATASTPTASNTTSPAEAGNEEDNEQHARVAAVVAAASVGGGEWRGPFHGEMHVADSLAVEAGGGVQEMIQLFGNGQQQLESQPEPEATEEVGEVRSRYASGRRTYRVRLNRS